MKLSTHLTLRLALGLFTVIALMMHGPQAYADVSPPSASLCADAASAIDEGSFPMAPGRWATPSRSGTAWDLFAVNGNNSMVAVWYTYDAAGRPRWLVSAANAIDKVNGTWQAPLSQVKWNTSTNTPLSTTKVGSVAIRFVPNNPGKVAMTWEWTTSLAQDTGADRYHSGTDCYFDVAHSGPDAGVKAVRANSTYSGFWHDPTTGYWGLGTSISQLTYANPGKYIEIQTLSAYDTSGDPIWVQAQSEITSQAPPLGDDSATRPLRFDYFRSTYPNGVPNTLCTSNCTSKTSNVGSMRRQYADTGRTMGVVINVDTLGRLPSGHDRVSWIRPLSGSAWYPLERFTTADLINVDRFHCDALPGENACKVTVNWVSPNTNARAFRYNISTGVRTLLNGGTYNGEETVWLDAGSRSRFELRAGSTGAATLLWQTPDVSAHADTSTALTPPAPENLADPGSSPTSDSVGATAAQFRVNESGAATYSIPLFAPPGSGGMTPQMSLNYASNAAEGVMGLGWSLGGLSSISRCRRTLETDGVAGGPIDFGFYDQYCLDGQRLVLVSGMHGATSAEYRTEIDSFARIVVESSATMQSLSGAFVPTPLVFVVTGKDGSVRRYGDESRAHPQTSAVLTTAGRVMSRAKTVDALGNVVEVDVVLGWMLTEINDLTAQNPSMFVYERYKDSTTGNQSGEHLLSSVQYNGGRIMFAYEARANSGVELQFVGGAAVQRTKRLRAVDVFAERSRGVYSASLRTYTMSYDRFANGHAAPHNYHTQSTRDKLLSIQECAGTTCFPATTFNWIEPNLIPGSGQVEEYASTTPASVNPTFAGLNALKFGDVDGDGRADAIWHDEQAHHSGGANSLSDLDRVMVTYVTPRAVMGGTSIGFTGPFVPSPLGDESGLLTERQRNLPFLGVGYHDEQSFGVFDFNADGRDDLSFASSYALAASDNNGRWTVRLSQATPASRMSATPFETVDINPTADGQPIGFESGRDRGLLMDINGDGLPDLVKEVDRANASRANFVVHLMQFNPAYNEAATGASPARLLYVFSSNALPVEVATGTPELSSNASAELMFFAEGQKNGVVADFDGDGRADLAGWISPTGTGRNELLMVPIDPPCPIPDDCTGGSGGSTGKSWIALRNDGIVGGVLKMSTYQYWAGIPGTTPATAKPIEGVNYADINADGLTDFLFRWKASDTVNTWGFQLNSGAGFALPQCVRSSGVIYPTNCGSFQNAEKVLLADYDADGRLDVWENSNSTTNNETYFYIHRWQGQSFGSKIAGVWKADIIDNPASDGYDPWYSYSADLDGDGYPESLQINGIHYSDSQYHGPSEQTHFRLRRLNSHHSQRYALTSITNGLGATSQIDYAPLSFSTLYKRDFVRSLYLSRCRIATSSNAYGRCAPVVDVAAPLFVVRSVKSSAPTSSYGTPVLRDDSALSEVLYQYEGLKVQGGGRGSLGFRRLTTIDKQTLVATTTEYRQNFPLIGLPLQTASTKLSALPIEMCTAGNYDAATCVANPAIASCAGGLCGFTYAGVPLSRAFTTWSWRQRNSNVDRVPIASMPAPAIIFPFRESTQSESFELNGGARTSFEITAFVNHDSYGNLLATEVDLYSGGMQFLRNTSSTFEYKTVPAGSWILGRLLRTTNRTTRTGQATQTRISEFEYSDSNGQLLAEHIEPTAGPADRLSTYYSYDTWGNKVKTMTCSGGVTATECKATTAATMQFQPSDALRVQRYTRVEYDSLGRFVDRSYAPFMTAGGTATERLVSSVTSRDDYGNAKTAVDANGVLATTAYGAFGRAYFSKSSLGASATTRYRWCSAGTCPAGAAYEVKSVPRGAPASWGYFDRLGREIGAVSVGFGTNQYVATLKTYDNLSRVTAVSEPFFAALVDADVTGVSTSPSVNAFTPTSGQTVYWTRSNYDILGRVTSVIAANGATTTTTHSPLTTTITAPANGSGQVQTKTEARNALGEIVTSSDANGHALTFGYTSLGESASVSRVVNGLTVVTSMGYDSRGRKTTMSDPDKGTWTYRYNALGELLRQSNARNACTQLRYDGQGRLHNRKDFLSHTANSSDDCNGALTHESRFKFDTANAGIGKLASDEQYQNNAMLQRRTMTYDSYGRASQVETLLGTSTYRSRATYDLWSRPFQDFFTAVSDSMAEHGELHQYNGRGYAQSDRDAHPLDAGDMLRLIVATDARGNVLHEQRGLGLINTLRTYAANTGWLTNIDSYRNYGAVAGSLQNLQYQFDLLGNVTRRADLTNAANRVETFTYDRLQRLLSSNLSINNISSRVIEYTYDSGGAGPGNLTLHSEWSGNRASLLSSSAYGYGAKSAYCSAANEVIPGPHAASTFGSTSFCFDAVGNQTRANSGRVLEYTAFDLPSRMTHTASNQKVEFDYGPSRERIRRFDYSGVGAINPDRTTHFVGNAEIVRFSSGKIEVRRYVAGTVRVRSKEAGRVAERIDFLFTDNLGSTHVITDMDAQVLNTMSFDAFGKRRDESSWLNHSTSTQLAYNSSAVTQHGYTGHEQVDSMGLIHMNGRMYDPVVMRFVQADPMVQAPTDTQSWNRYTYVFNNPLSHTDPTGYWGKREQGALRTVAAIVISYVTAGIASGPAMTATQSFWVSVVGGAAAGAVQTGTARGALTGAFSAGLFSKIGTWAGTAGESGSWNWAQRAAAHGAAGGIMAELQGGNFGHGFASASFSSATGSAIGNSIDNAAIEGIAYAIIGGTAAEISGGKFANGAVTSAFGYAFNHLSHAANAANFRKNANITFSGDESEALRREFDALWGKSRLFQGAVRIAYSRWKALNFTAVRGDGLVGNFSQGGSISIDMASRNVYLRGIDSSNRIHDSKRAETMANYFRLSIERAILHETLHSAFSDSSGLRSHFVEDDNRVIIPLENKIWKLDGLSGRARYGHSDLIFADEYFDRIR